MTDNEKRHVWTDPETGIHYNAETMVPLSTAGESLGELPSDAIDAPPLSEQDVLAAMRALGLNAE